MGVTGCLGGGGDRMNIEWGYLLDDLRAFGINANQWTTAAYSRTRGICARRRNKWRDVSLRNGALHRKSGLDYNMQ